MLRALLSSICLLLALPAMGQAHLMQNNSSSAAAATDWTGSFVAVWLFEDSDDLGVNEVGTTCGTDCDMAENGTPLQSTTAGQFMEGAGSLDLGPIDNDDFLSCVPSTCDELDVAAGENITFGCWNKTDQEAANAYTNYRSGFSDKFYFIQIQSFQAKWTCGIGDDTDTVQASGTEDLAEAGDPISHVVCSFDNVGDVIQLYYNGATDGSATQQDAVSGTIGSTSIGSAGADFDGQLDECFYIKDLLTAPEICRICSCGIDGSRCTCDGTSYVDAGDNTYCGSCTSTDCNAAAP